MSEDELQDHFVELGEMLGWKMWHHSDSRRPAKVRGKTVWVGDPRAKGLPDWTCAHPRHGVMFVELKRQDGRLSDAQREALEVLSAAGARAFCWRPSNWPYIEKVLMGKA